MTQVGRTVPSMTVAVVVKVFDGVVIAADSATTMMLTSGGAQVYNNANKVFQVHRGLPIGALTWGLGNIGDASIATLTKDLRRRLMGEDPAYPDWTLDPTAYTLEQVMGRVVEMFYDELYVSEFAGEGVAPGATLGFLLAGYSAMEKQPEVWKVVIADAATRPVPELEASREESGWSSYAQPQATERLFNGADQNLIAGLQAVLPLEEFEKAQDVLARSMSQPAIPAMPFVDAVQLARFLVEVTVGFSHYLLGPDTVGGPIDVAGINRHEGFKWISRKHYYSAEVNPM